MRLLRWIPVLAAAAAMSISAVPSAASAATELDFHATLHHSAAYSTATGYSEYERVGTARELEVTVRHLHRLVGKRVSVFVNGHKVGTMLVNRYGNAHREWDTRHGQYVPWAGAGTPIRIRNAYGTLIASARYYRSYP